MGLQLEIKNLFGLQIEKFMIIKELGGGNSVDQVKQKNYKVDDIDYTMNPLSTFETRNCSQLSFVDYFMQQYKKQIKNLKQPLS